MYHNVGKCKLDVAIMWRCVEITEMCCNYFVVIVILNNGVGVL